MRYAFAVLLVACGPNVGVVDDEGGTTSEGGTTDATTATTGVTSASTTASTTATTATTMMSTTAPGDESTTDESTSTGADTGEGGVFIPDPDPDSGCFEVCIECDLWAQDCQEGDKCMAWADDGGDVWTSTRCTPVAMDNAAIGETCVVEGSGVSGIDDCGIRAICWGVDPRTNEGTCVPMCDGSEANPTCPDGLECTIAFEAPLIVCLPPCDPLAPTCAADEVCSALAHSSTSDIRFACQPLPPFQPQPYGSACGGVQICDVGQTCVAAEHVPGCAGVDCCTQLGDSLQMPTCPEATQTCIPFDGSTPHPSLCFCGVAA